MLGSLLRWAADKAGGAAIGAGVAAGLGALVLIFAGGGSGHEGRPSLAKQWLREHKAIARKRWQISQTRRIDLRGIGEPSTVLVLHSLGNACTGPSATRCDQIRIYDVEEGELHRALVFGPKQKGCSKLEFTFMTVAPLREGNNTPLAIGRFSGRFYAFGEDVSVPVVISWDDRLQEYRLDPLLVEPPRLVPYRHYEDGRPLNRQDRSYYRSAVRFFGRPFDLGSGLRGFAAETLDFGQTSLGPMLTGLYRLNSGLRGERGDRLFWPLAYQQAVWSLETTPEGSLFAGWCNLNGRVLSESYKDPEDMAGDLLRQASSRLEGCASY